MKAAGGGLCWIIQNVRDSYVMADNGFRETELQERDVANPLNPGLHSVTAR